MTVEVAALTVDDQVGDAAPAEDPIKAVTKLGKGKASVIARSPSAKKSESSKGGKGKGMVIISAPSSGYFFIRF